MSCQVLKGKNKKIITFLIISGLVGASAFILSQLVFAQEMGNPLHKIRSLYLEIQETPYPQNIPLVEKEGGIEKIVGSAKIVDQYLVTDLPENEFLEEFPYLRSGFEYLSC